MPRRDLTLPVLRQDLLVHKRGLRDIGEQGQPHAREGHVTQGESPPGVIAWGAVWTRNGTHIALADQQRGQALCLGLAQWEGPERLQGRHGAQGGCSRVQVGQERAAALGRGVEPGARGRAVAAPVSGMISRHGG